MELGPDSNDRDASAPQPNDQSDACWSRQLNNSFLFCPYWPANEEPFTTVTIAPFARRAEALLAAAAQSPEEPAYRQFVLESAPAVCSTVLYLTDTDDGETAESIYAAALRTQKRLAEWGELRREELEMATVIAQPSSIRESLPPGAVGYLALSLADASAALAAQRSGIPADAGRALLAAELILELRDRLHALL